MSTSWIIAWIVLGLILIPVQLYIPAPYGRHASRRWGLSIPYRAGWMIMEVTALVAFAVSFVAGGEGSVITLFIASLFALHYVHRSLIYPVIARMSSRQIPVLVVLFAIVFNLVNGVINGEYLGTHASSYPAGYALTWNFIIGLLLFGAGAIVNIRSDYVLISLRKDDSDDAYQIPGGLLFRYVSCPNHLGEIIEWAGFALMCWNLPAVAFAVWTAGNLIPRAVHHHRWYKEKFAAYPPQRRAIIPYLL